MGWTSPTRFRGSCLELSVARDAGVDLLRPGVDAAREVIDRLEALTLQECDDLRTPGAVMTDADDRLHRIELGESGRHAVHRHQPRLESVDADRRVLELPRFANV